MGLPSWQPGTPSLAFEREAFLPLSAPSSPSALPRPAFTCPASPDSSLRHSPKPAIPKRSLSKWLLVLSVPALLLLLVLMRSSASSAAGGPGLPQAWEDTFGKGADGIKDWAMPGASSGEGQVSQDAGTESSDGLLGLVGGLGEASLAAGGAAGAVGGDREISEITTPPPQEPNSGSPPTALDPDADVDADTIEVTALPRLGGPIDDSAKYLGFLPHSGYHNQRVALQNALTLGWLLNRTVLIPPVWIGWPIPAKVYGEMQQVWNDVVTIQPESFGFSPAPEGSLLSQPAHYASSKDDFATPASLVEPEDWYAKQQASYKKMGKYYASLGYDVRPDGFPITNLTAAECKSYSPECRHTYKDTFLAWDFLVDIKSVEDKVKVVDRWDMRESAVEEILGVKRDDIFVIQDSEKFDFQFTDYTNPPADLPLIHDNTNADHWKRNVSINAMRELPHKVVLVGSLFGWGRVTRDDNSHEAKYFEFARSLAFRNPWLLGPADAIRDRLGGPDGYVGVHARVGDGVFLDKARANMEETWRRVAYVAGADDDVVEEMWEVVKPVVDEPEPVQGMKRVKRSVEARQETKREEVSAWAEVDQDDFLDTLDAVVREHASTLLGASSHRRVTKRSTPLGPRQAASLSSLTCRGKLHTATALAPFNIPVYLATDSRDPTADPNLMPFFAAFPCTFILSDFDHPTQWNEGEMVAGVGRMMKLANRIDHQPLGRLFLPFLEATIAAKGFAAAGTFGSTFSDFATKEMHQSYRDEWDAAENAA